MDTTNYPTIRLVDADKESRREGTNREEKITMLETRRCKSEQLELGGVVEHCDVAVSDNISGEG